GGQRSRSFREAAAAGDSGSYPEDHDPEQEEPGIIRRRVRPESARDCRRSGQDPRVLAARVDDLLARPRQGARLTHYAPASLEKGGCYHWTTSREVHDGDGREKSTLRGQRPAVRRQDYL